MFVPRAPNYPSCTSRGSVQIRVYEPPCTKELSTQMDSGQDKLSYKPCRTGRTPSTFGVYHEAEKASNLCLSPDNTHECLWSFCGHNSVQPKERQGRCASEDFSTASQGAMNKTAAWCCAAKHGASALQAQDMHCEKSYFGGLNNASIQENNRNGQPEYHTSHVSWKIFWFNGLLVACCVLGFWTDKPCCCSHVVQKKQIWWIIEWNWL